MLHRRRQIERYLTEGASPEEATELRVHLHQCEDCRAFYDEQVLLLRALAGRSSDPTAREERRAEARALSAAALAQDVPLPAQHDHPVPRWMQWWQALGSRPRYLAAAATTVALLTVVVLVAGRLQGPVKSATVIKARALTLSGKPASAGTQVMSGQMLAVGPDGFAELAVEVGGSLRLFSKSAAVLQPGGAGVDLSAGKVWCQIDPAQTATRPSAAARFRVTTDRGEARVVGTSFVVEKMPTGEMEVRVLAGKVAVEDSGHRGTVEVQGGQKARVDRGPPGPVQAYAGEDADEWSLLEFFKRIGRAFLSIFGS